MSVPYRGQAQPQDHQQQYHDYDPSQQYGQDPGYAHYAGQPFQQQQGYYQPPQHYPTSNPYANHGQTSFSPYSQHMQRAAPSYHAQSQSFASPNDLGYQTALPQGGYLAGNEYGPPSHVMQGSLSSGHSPGSSTGRSRLSTLVYPSQGPSPSLESQVSHLSLVGPTASLPSKPLPHSTSHAAARHSQSLPSNAPVTASGELRSGISLRYPPLPSVPERCTTPPSLRSEADAATEAGTVDKSVLDYISSLRSIIDAYEKRDDHLRMRTEAVGFQPKQAWAAWESAGAENSSHDTASAALPPANAVLGVRLLQRLDKLQRENDELGALLTSGARINADAAAGTAETEELRKEVHDCHQLIEAIDKALVEAEGRASASERALEAACRTNSTAMVPAKPGATSTKAAGAVAAATGSAQEAKKPSPKPTNASAARRGSKPVISSSSPNAGAGGKVAYQQRNSKPNQPTPKSGGGSGSSRTTRNDKSAAQTADGKTGKTPSPSAVTKGK